MRVFKKALAQTTSSVKSTDPNAKAGDLRVEMSFLDLDPGDWCAQVQIYDVGSWHPLELRWIDWDTWAREQPRSFSRVGWPETFASGEVEEEVRAEGCHMLQNVRKFVPRERPKDYTIAEGDCP